MEYSCLYATKMAMNLIPSIQMWSRGGGAVD